MLFLTTAACGAGLTDVVDLGDAAAAKAHQLQTDGEASMAVVGDFVGGHDMRRAARIIAASGALSFELCVEAQAPLTLEFEEIDGRSSDVRGYQVLVDQRPVYFRTWRGCGAGPVHYFVQLPPPGRDRVTVQLVNRSATSVAIARVWAWGDFETFFDANDFATPFYLAPTVPLSGDVAADQEKLRQLAMSFGAHAQVKAAWTTWIGYAADERRAFAQIDEALALADELNLPAQLCFDSWWSHTPAGSDGKGGHWTDDRYQQFVWNQTRQRMQRSIPNRWANTPWLTLDDPGLNAFKVERATACAAYLRQRVRELQSHGKRSPVLAINLDNEPIYWASGNAGLGADLLWADFNPSAVAAAKADGVTLDPRDGLSTSERRWLWRNLLHYNQRIASAVIAGLGSGANTMAGDPLANNVYTQAMMMASPEAQFPMQDRAFGLWEAGAPAACRVGGEWNEAAAAQREAIEHQLPLGRTAAVNAECEDDASHHACVAPAYALGQQFCALYNYPLNRMNVAAGDLDNLDAPIATLSAERALAEHTFDDDQWKNQVVSTSGLITKRLGNTALTAVCPQTPATVAHLTYRLDCSTAPDGLAVEISGRATDFRGLDPAVQIRVLAGDADNDASLREIAVLLNFADLNGVHRVDLSEAARDAKQLFVRIELRAPTLPPEVMEWCCVHRVRFTKAWPAKWLEGLPPQDLSMRRQRKQHLLISWRRDAELAIAQASGAAAGAARAAYEHGDYARAYRRASGVAIPSAAATQPLR